MKQEKNAKKLKALMIVVALLGAVYAGLRCYVWYMQSEMFGGKYFYSQLFTAILVVVFCTLALIEFWKVCNRIQVDESFSYDNVKSFRRIATYAFVVGAAFIVRIVVLAIPITRYHFSAILYAVLFATGAIVVSVLCRILASLIQNAADIKQENDLTI